MGRRGPKPLPAAEKARRGTLRPSRERARTTRRKRTRPPAAVHASPRDYVAIADGYVRDVLHGRVIAGAWVRKACERYFRMLERAAESGSPFYFSTQHANDVCAFAERCPHVEGSWTSDTIELRPWQAFILVACYGFRRRDTDRRLVTTVFFQVSRKSAKSTLVAIAALYHLAVEKEPGAQVICAASTGSQARLVFGIMQKMVRKSPYLRDLGFIVFANAITFDATGGCAKPINSKSSTQDGLNPSFISLDESHAQTFELHDVLKSAMGARADGMMWLPTTAGYDLTSVGYSMRSTAAKLLDGVIEADHVFAILYELDEADRWDDETAWRKAAPMLGITPSLEWVRRYCLDAQHTPALQAEFQTKVCNRWLHAASSWLSMAAWDACADPAMRLESFERERCWIGADLAAVDDLAAVALVFERGDALYGFVRCYLPEHVVNERARRVPEYRLWADAGLLILTPGNMIDYGRIEADIRAWAKRFKVQDIVFDQFGSIQISGELANDGLPARIEPKNAKSFTPPARELEGRVRYRRFRHDGNNCLKWQASNVVVSRRVDDSILPKKEHADSELKIDAIDALCQAIGGYLRQPAKRAYRSGGILVL